jgi:hypothetical protein
MPNRRLTAPTPVGTAARLQPAGRLSYRYIDPGSSRNEVLFEANLSSIALIRLSEYLKG